MTEDEKQSAHVREGAQKARAVLHNLAHGRDADSIAAFLHVRGATGMPSSAAFCPLAEYLREVTGLQWVRVGWENIGWKVNDVVQRSSNPPQLRRFLVDFDYGLYPELFPKEEPFRSAADSLVSYFRSEAYKKKMMARV